MSRLKLLIVLLFSLLLLVEGSSRVLLAKKGKGNRKGGNKNKKGGNKNKKGGNKNKKGGNKDKKGGDKDKKGGDNDKKGVDKDKGLDKNGWSSSDSAPLPSPLSYPQTTEEKFHPSRVIVKYKSLNGADGVSISRASNKWRSVNTGKGESVAAAMKRLNDDPNVASVEEDFIVQAVDAAPSDPEFVKQWGWTHSGTLDAWSANVTGSSSVKVCVIDTGIASDHVDLRLNTASGIGYSAGDVVSSNDENNHGSHVAGVIGASVDSTGVAGMNKAVTMIPCRFLSASGSGYISDAILCLNYCVAQGAQISNNSWGGGGFSLAFLDALRAAGRAGHLFIAAAGNSGVDADLMAMYPAAYNESNVISVAAIDSSNNLASFSNYGRSSVDIGAPGVDIYSTLKSGWDYLSGTSMAAPHVAGAAALLKAANPSASYSEIKAALLDGVAWTSSLVGKTTSSGRLNLGRSLELIMPPPPPPIVNPWPSPPTVTPGPSPPTATPGPSPPTATPGPSPPTATPGPSPPTSPTPPPDPFYLGTNGVTIFCPGAAVGDTGVVNGVEYTKRDRQGLLVLVGTAKEGDLATSCTSGVTDMSYMFSKASDFNVKIGSWDTSSVMTMERMFNQASSFNRSISSWNTHLVTNMQGMFAYAFAFNQNIGAWNTGSVKLMNRMFDNAKSFNQDIGKWNTGKVTNMEGMFYYATSFNQDIGKWNTAQVLNMRYMFYRATAFNQDLLLWNVSKVGSCTAFAQYVVAWTLPKPRLYATCLGFAITPIGIYCPDADVGDTGVVDGITYTKRDRKGLLALVGTAEEGELATSCTTGVTDMSSLFKDASSFNGNISSWDTVQATTMSSMFQGATSFNQDISKWYTGSITSMQSMFDSATAFNQDIGKWRPERVTDMSSMFQGAAAFNQNIGSWRTAAVTNMRGMFNGAAAFDQDISEWNTGSVTSMQSMFESATAFDQDVSKWDTSSVTDMEKMFDGAISFNRDLSSWNVVKVGSTCTAFFEVNAGAWTLPKPALPVYCLGFTTATNGVTVLCPDAAVGDVGVVNGVEYMKRDRAGLLDLVGTANDAGLAKSCTTGVTDMSYMFKDASSFNGNISSWDTSSVTDMREMFYGATAFNQDLSSWNVDTVGSICTAFGANAGAWTLPKPSLPDSCIGFTIAANGVTVLCRDARVGDVGVVNGVTYTKRDRKGLLALVGTSNEGDLAKSCTSGVTDMSAVFSGASSFNGNISSWDTSSVTTMAACSKAPAASTRTSAAGTRAR